MSIIAGGASELHVFQEMTWANVDSLIDAFINQYGFTPCEIWVSEAGKKKLESDLPSLGLKPALLSKLARYRGVTVQMQAAFSDDTIELVGFEDK